MARYEKIPAYQNGERAIVLGARMRSWNIGEAIVDDLCRSGFLVVGEDCHHESGAYNAPTTAWFREQDADVLVVSLGKAARLPFEELDPAKLMGLIHANLALPLECALRYVRAAEAASAYRQGATRRIVFIGSYAHNHPFTNGTVYCAAKAGLDMAARTLGWELTDKGYRVNIVHPYHVAGTPMWTEVEEGFRENHPGWTEEKCEAYHRKDLRMPDLLSPGQVARVVRRIIEEEDFAWTSGTSIELYGGTR